MKIGLTGHTRGFGKFVHDRLITDHELFCFSKTTGYDISKYDARKQIVAATEDCDVFINCAQKGFAQTELLYERFASWANQKKMIINIGSNARDFTNRDRAYDYSVQKLALNHASKQLGRSSICKVVTVDYGFLIRESGSVIGYEDAYYYFDLALKTFDKPHRLLEILVAHD